MYLLGLSANKIDCQQPNIYKRNIVEIGNITPEFRYPMKGESKGTYPGSLPDIYRKSSTTHKGVELPSKGLHKTL